MNFIHFTRSIPDPAGCFCQLCSLIFATRWPEGTWQMENNQVAFSQFQFRVDSDACSICIYLGKTMVFKRCRTIRSSPPLSVAQKPARAASRLQTKCHSNRWSYLASSHGNHGIILPYFTRNPWSLHDCTRFWYQILVVLQHV